MNTTLEDRAAGVLIGLCVGDALGASYEYRRPPKLGEACMRAGGLANWEPGEWTDDGSQAICVAQARAVPADTGRLLLNWYDGNPPDVGTTTRRAMHGARDARELAEQAARVQGKSNGSLMRTAPVALAYLGDRAAVAKAAAEVSSLTHAHPDAVESCVLWSLLVEQAVREGGPLETSWLTDAISYLPEHRRGLWEARVRQVIRYPDTNWGDNGQAVKAFQGALAAVLHTPGQRLEDILQRAVSYGGDTDTVAAIAGSLAGAMNGASAVPSGWLRVLHGWPGMNAGDLYGLALDALPEGVRA